MTATRSASRGASSWSWVTSTPVAPARAQDADDVAAQAARAGRRRARRTARRAGRRRARGEGAGEGDALALAAGELARDGCCARSASPTSSSARAARARVVGGRRRRRCRATVRCGNSVSPWGTRPTPRCSGSTQRPEPATHGDRRWRRCPGPGARSRRSGAAAWSCRSRSGRARPNSSPRRTSSVTSSTRTARAEARASAAQLERGASRLAGSCRGHVGEHGGHRSVRLP